MSFHKYLAEFIGTLVLTLMVLLTIAGSIAVPTPFMAAVTLAFLVYLLGGVSGAHFNPAITLGLLTINKIHLRNAGYYIVSQLLGAMAAMMIGSTFFERQVVVGASDLPVIGVAEAMGALVLCFAVTSVTIHKVEKAVTGGVIGAGLYVGVLLATPISNAVLNPAVALGIGSFSMAYAFGPIVGAILGAILASVVNGEKVRFRV